METLGADQVVAIGNGANDVQMLAKARLGIGVLGHEGLFAACVAAADILVPCIQDALDVLLYPQQLAPTLRR